MNRLKAILTSLACLLFIAVAPVDAALLRYDITGDIFFSSTVMVGHPVATLLNVTPDAQAISLKASLVLDTESEPYVHYDTVTFQEVTYRDAIVRATIELNGIEWTTIRSPTQYPSATPLPANSWPSGEESKVRITNFTTSNGNDFFNMTLKDTNQTTPTRLFDNHTAPVDQTFNGTYYEDAVVGLGSFSFQCATSNFNGYEIPSGNNFLDLGQGIQMSLFSDGDEDQFDFGSVSLMGSNFVESEIDVSISPVPIPSAVWLLTSGIIGLVGFRGKKRQ